MLNEHQKAKLIEWAEWTLAHDGDARLPHGARKIEAFAYFAARSMNADFPTTEQMEPTRADFGLEG